MDKYQVKPILIWTFCLIFVITSLYFGFIKGSLGILEANGFQAENLYFLLIIPFIVLFLSFWKIILGFSVINTFVPILIILTCFITGPFFPLIILLFSLLLGYLAKLSINDLRLHYAVKLSIILTVLSIGLLLILPYVEKTTSYQPGNEHLIISYAILIISLINEHYFAFKVGKTNTVNIIKNALLTFLFSFICFFLLGGQIQYGTILIQFPYLRDAIVSYPDLIFLDLFLLILIGSYTGLRLTEMIRFRKLIFKNR